MSEEKTNSIKATSCEAMLNGEKIVIQKLKAGEYYEAQKIYVGMIDKIRNQVGGEGKPQEKNKDVDTLNSLDINNLYSVFPQEIVKLVAFCINLDAEKLLQDAYPEEISELANKIIELNNFNQNLKNSIAPLASLGAEK